MVADTHGTNVATLEISAHSLLKVAVIRNRGEHGGLLLQSGRRVPLCVPRQEI